VAMLAEQGKLSLNDDVRKYIPEMKVRGDTIRIRHLLNHTSGLRDEFNLLTMEGFGIEDAVTFEHSVRMLTNQKELLFTPGERWEYCNSGYTLLAEIISRVTKKPYADWMRENVFVPLGMTRTSFPALGAVIRGRAYSYTEESKGWRMSVISKTSLGCSNLFSTVEDMAKWAINFTNAKVGGRAVIDRMSERGVLNDGTVTDYAYGQVYR
jgi:CubicO group peptidase (beta-lactamase class C family)